MNVLRIKRGGCTSGYYIPMYYEYNSGQDTMNVLQGIEIVLILKVNVLQSTVNVLQGTT